MKPFGDYYDAVFCGAPEYPPEPSGEFTYQDSNKTRFCYQLDEGNLFALWLESDEKKTDLSEIISDEFLSVLLEDAETQLKEQWSY